MAKKFIVAKNEVSKVRKWLHSASMRGTIRVEHRHIEQISTQEQAQRIVDRDLEPEERHKLQVALAVSRSRAKNANSQVVKTELSKFSRDILLSVAKSRNISTSELIEQTFRQEYDRLDENR